jgi:Domain of unknown function (DUF1707)
LPSLEVDPLAQPGDTANVAMEVADGTATRPGVLASDADRETIAGRLSSAFAEGRLTASEHAERIRATYEARTMGELAGLTADLPDMGGDAGWQHAVVPDGVDRCALYALLICCPPAGIARLLAARRRARAGGGAGAADR